MSLRPQFDSIASRQWQQLPDHARKEIADMLLELLLIPPPSGLAALTVSGYEVRYSVIANEWLFIHGIEPESTGR